MAIQSRRGDYSKFDPSKLSPGEWAVVVSGDPNASDGLACYMCFQAGTVKRMATYEDMIDQVGEAYGEYIAGEIDSQCQEAIKACTSAASTATTAAGNANTAKTNADKATTIAANAAQEATKAAEAANAYVLGDISGKTVDFTQASVRNNIIKGENLETLFGKIKKYFADLKTGAFNTVSNTLSATASGYVLDARQGKVLDDKITAIQEEMQQAVSGKFTLENGLKICWGTVTGLSCTATGSSSFNASLPVAYAGTDYIAILTPNGAKISARIYTQTTTKITGYISSLDGTAVTSASVNWMTIGY